MATVFNEKNSLTLCGTKTEHDENKPRKPASTFFVSVEYIIDNDQFLEVLYDNAPRMFSSMFENIEKLKSCQKFVFNDSKSSIFCNIWMAEEIFPTRSNRDSEKLSNIFYGHHIMLLIPIKNYFEDLKENIKTNIETFLEKGKHWHQFSSNLLNAFDEIEKLHLSITPCKMLIDFQGIAFNTLTDLSMNLKSIFQMEHFIPICITNPLPAAKKDNTKVMFYAVKIGIKSLSIISHLSEICCDIHVSYSTKQFEMKSFDVIIIELSNIWNKIIKANTSDNGIPENEIFELYAYFFHFYSMLWKEDNNKKDLFEAASKDLKYLFKDIAHIEDVVKNLWSTHTVTKNPITKEKITNNFYFFKNSEIHPNSTCLKGMKKQNLSISKTREKTKKGVTKRGRTKSLNLQENSDTNTANCSSDGPNITLQQNEHFITVKQQQLHQIPLISEQSEIVPNVPLMQKYPSTTEEQENEINESDCSDNPIPMPKDNVCSDVENDFYPNTDMINENLALNLSAKNPLFNPIKPSTIKKTDLKIIFVGETGSGKSTIINGFQNYLNCQNSMEFDKFAEVSCVIPVKFAIQKPGDPFNNIWIEYGQNDENENFEKTSESFTQKPKIYKINVENSNLTIIDTPGTSDTRGSAQDLENLKMIKQTVEDCGKIDAICFVISSNEKKFTSGFENRMNNLLSLFLPQRNLNNVYFFFTYVSQNYFEIGDALPNIEKFIQIYNERNMTDIKISAENIFRIENDGFRYLISQKVGNVYYSQPEEHYKYCWNFTAKEIQRFIAILKAKKDEEKGE